MEAGAAIRIETNVDRTASALFAGAVAYAAWIGLAPALARPMLAASAATVCALGFFASTRILRAVQPGKLAPPLRVFDIREVEPEMLAEPDVLELTDVVAQVAPVPSAESNDLVLDDILAKLAPDSRVVRLFDPAAMPTAGELQDRIDRHLDQPANGSADAAQALHDALAELRRSLR